MCHVRLCILINIPLSLIIVLLYYQTDKCCLIRLVPGTSLSSFLEKEPTVLLFRPGTPRTKRKLPSRRFHPLNIRHIARSVSSVFICQQKSFSFIQLNPTKKALIILASEIENLFFID